MEITLAQQSFRFLLGAPVLSFNDRLQPLAGWAFRARDSLYLPLQFVTEILPRLLAERYAWDAIRGRLLDTGPAIPARPGASPSGSSVSPMGSCRGMS